MWLCVWATGRAGRRDRRYVALVFRDRILVGGSAFVRSFGVLGWLEERVVLITLPVDECVINELLLLRLRGKSLNVRSGNLTVDCETTQLRVEWLRCAPWS